MGKKPHVTPPVNDDARTIVWVSNSPGMATGYGTQTAQVVSRLARDGHRVSIASNYGSEGQVSSWNGIRVWPRGLSTYSEDAIPAYTQAWAHENRDPHPLVMTLFDCWVYNDFPEKVPQVASWVPIDHDPAPAPVLRFLAKPNVTPIAMSQFGQRALQDAGHDALYAPHALESVWRPTPSYKGRSVREIMGIPEDAYCITINQANKGNTPPRKSWYENLAAAAEMLRRHNDCWLYLHTEASGSMGGIQIARLLQAVDAPMDRVSIVEQFAYRMGIEQEAVAAIYTASDILLACSMGEGFGLTVLEAQATGTPVAVSNWTAQPELVGDGWIVDGQRYWNEPQGSFWLTPDINQIIDALEQAYARGRYRSQQAIDFARQYDADRVYDAHWRPILKALAP